MNYVLKTLLANGANIGRARNTEGIRWLVYHYTANDGDTAMANAEYFASNAVGASAHYFVDDKTVVRSVPDERIAWSVGGGKWADCAQTGGGAFFGRCMNSNSLSIEMCDTRMDGRYGFTQATIENAAALGRALMKKYRIPPERVIRHFDVNGKHCPGCTGWWGRGDGEWKKFKEMLEGKMTGEEIFNALNTYLAEIPESEWSRAEGGFEKARVKKVMDGTTPHRFVTRQQLAAILSRLGLLE